MFALLAMIIDLVKVVPRRVAIETYFDATEIDLDPEDVELVGKAHFQGETERVEGKAHLRGTIIAQVQTACTRCLETVEKGLTIEFEDIFVERSDDDEIDLELDEGQLDESVAEDGTIDLKEVVREQILLAMPEHPLCTEDCRGLCPQCGGNRNLIDCKCEENEIDPRWAALKDIN